MALGVGATGSLTLRPATEGDRGFLLDLYASTREQELAQVVWPAGQREAFVRSQFEAQAADFRRRHPNASFDVVELDGIAVGRLYVDHGREEVRVMDIAIRPEWRGHGLGTGLLTTLLDEAAATGRKVTLHVEAANPAARLYERLGFVLAEDLGIRRRMEWRAPR